MTCFHNKCNRFMKIYIWTNKNFFHILVSYTVEVINMIRFNAVYKQGLCLPEVRVAMLKTNEPVFSSWLKEHRKQSKLTQDELAELSHVDQGLISKYERGILMPAKKSIVLDLARGLFGSSFATDRFLRGNVNQGLKAASFAPIETDEPPTRPMMTFLEQKLRVGPGGSAYSLTPAQADQLVSELEEMAGLRIAQVQRQSKA